MEAPISIGAFSLCMIKAIKANQNPTLAANKCLRRGWDFGRVRGGRGFVVDDESVIFNDVE